ncbi:hypothetical protein Mapa_014530 [Marchantia paleacea]|nr:hypothetical protein Mapa_014530 [Marchantia paleacea]
MYKCKLSRASFLYFHNCEAVLFEDDREGITLDALVTSNKPKLLIWMFVEKHILANLYQLCTSAEGSPGLSQVVEILRAECGRQLRPCAQLTDQVV